MNDESERTWKEAVMAKFKTLPHHLPGGTEKPIRIAVLQASV
jgi:hypothetical protein